MIVSPAELAGLAAISGGGWLPGLPPPVTGAGQAAAALEGLRARGVVDAAGRVTPSGMVPVGAVDRYRRADRRVCVNQVRASLDDDGAVTVLGPVGGGWAVARMSPPVLMVALLRMFPWLRLGGPDGPAGPWEALTASQWARRRPPGPVDDVVVVRDTSVSRGWSRTVAYDRRGDSGFAFDLDRGAGRELPVWRVRAEIAGLFQDVPGGDHVEP